MTQYVWMETFCVYYKRLKKKITVISEWNQQRNAAITEMRDGGLPEAVKNIIKLSNRGIEERNGNLCKSVETAMTAGAVVVMEIDLEIYNFHHQASLKDLM